MELESKVPPLEADSPQDVPNTSDQASTAHPSDRKDEDEEEEEEEEEDKIVEKSHNSRFHKRNKRFPKQIQGVDNAFVAIEPKSGKEVIWNECLLSDKKNEKENRYLSIIKKLKRSSHPFLARFLDAWTAKSDDGSRKLVFIIERLDECSLKQFLCNSPKNSRSWKRQVGQLLSVLMFLHRLGITHGNLTKETIYYQNSGNLRVGPFSLGGCLDQKSQSSDLSALGVVALEIAVWTPNDFPQTLAPTDLIQEMLTRLDNSEQRSFIETCLDSTASSVQRMKRLINHPAVTEVPILKLLSAKVIVGNMRSVTNEEGTASEQTGFATLLKEYLSHYEDEAVIVEVHFLHDNVVKCRTWKDFRSNFTLTPKFLDDVKNGFYPLFGCRWNWATYQDEDEESLGAGFTPCPANGVVATSSTASLVCRGEIGTMPSQAQSSVASTVPSACVSRKHSAAARATEAVAGAPVLLEHEDVIDETHAASSAPATKRSSSLCDQPPVGGIPAFPHCSRQSDSSVPNPSLLNQPIHVLSKDEVSSNPSVSFCIGGYSEAAGQSPNLRNAEHQGRLHVSCNVSPTLGGQSTERSRHSDSALLGRSTVSDEAIKASTPHSGTPGDTSKTFDPVGVSASSAGKEHVLDGEKSKPGLAEPSPAPPTSQTTVAFDLSKSGSSKDFAGAPVLSHIEDRDVHRPPSSDRQACTTGRPVEETGPLDCRAVSDSVEQGDLEEDLGEEEDKDEDDEDDNDDDEDEDEDKDPGGALDRFEPQTIHVAAPERAPSHPALFTHCQYLYIGAGRWQVYVQMWFVEERLKRETYVQVFDYEWHDYERVADLFEASRCLNSVDRPSLVRLLALARHNCSLVDGELQFPGPLGSRPNHFDAFELHEKLTVLRLHQQAREQLLQREAEAQDHSVLPDHTQDPSMSASGLDTGQPSSLPAEKDTTTVSAAQESTEHDARSLPAPEEVPACADHAAQLQEQQRGLQKPGRATTSVSRPYGTVDLETVRDVQPAVIGRVRSEVPGSNTTLFLDVGALAPRNSYCALCDTHDYLHRVDLPAYLISPCYHCREVLAREAKISPEVLLDLHLQHSIPWPAYLQARFNLPTDGRSIEELIAYDCRWRSRQPCRCLVPSGGPLLPPCVEFPWLCPPATAVSWNGSAQLVSSGQAFTAQADTENEPGISIPSSSTLTVDTGSHPYVVIRRGISDVMSGSPPQVTMTSHPTSSLANVNPPQSHTLSRGPLPCSNRHIRGAPTTCCHGIQFPRVNGTFGNAPTSVPSQTAVTLPETCQAASIASGTAASNAPQSAIATPLTNGVVS